MPFSYFCLPIERQVNAILFRGKEEDDAELRIIFSKAQGREFMGRNTDAPEFDRVYAAFAGSSLPEDSARKPVVLNGTAACAIWALIERAADAGMTSMEGLTPAIGYYGCCFPSEPGTDTGFISHTDARGDHVDFFCDKEKALAFADTFKGIETPANVAFLKAAIQRSVLPGTSTRMSVRVSDEVAALVRAATQWNAVMAHLGTNRRS